MVGINDHNNIFFGGMDPAFVTLGPKFGLTPNIPVYSGKLGVNVEYSPFDDLRLCFESTSSDWPGLIICIYHLKNSPLLRGMNKNKLCSNAPLYPGPPKGAGRCLLLLEVLLTGSNV